MLRTLCLCLIGLVWGTASPARDIALPGPRAYPESVASGPDGTLYVSNIAEGGVVRVRPGKPARVWIKPGTFGLRSSLGVLVDARRGLLWVCSNDFSARGMTNAGEPGSALKGFDLRSGRGVVSLTLGPARATCNDIAVADDGAVYVTDTASPRILRLAPDGDVLAEWVTDPAFQQDGGGLDGIAIGGDGHVYVNTINGGRFFRIATDGAKPGAITELTLSRPLARPDGMRHETGNQFILAESTGRLVRIVARDRDAIVTTLRDGLDGPAAVALIGRTAWVAEGQLRLLFDPALKGRLPTLPFRLRGIDLVPE